MILDPRCLVYSVRKWRLWNIFSVAANTLQSRFATFLGAWMTLAIFQQTGDYIPNFVLTSLKIIFKKAHPSILLHIEDASTQKVLIILLPETKRDIIVRHAQLQTSRRREELHDRIQANLVSVVNKIIALL
jgi:hypothetical protein